MTCVLAVGFAHGEFLRDQRAVHAFADTLRRDDLERLVELVADDLTGEGSVLAIIPAWWSEPALQRLQTVRSALDASRLLVHASPLPPLAGSVLCALAATLAPHVQVPGLLYAGLPLLERQILPVARLKSVSKLREPAPSIWQHLASWWPSTSFAVCWWPRPSVRRLRGRDASVPLPPRAAWSSVTLDQLAVAAPEGARTDWVTAMVASPLDVESVTRVPAPALTARFWGTSSVLEAAAYPSAVALLASWLTEGHQAGRCSWCGEQVVSPECPFCRADRGAAQAGGGWREGTPTGETS